MTSQAPSRFFLDHDGHRLEVETGSSRLATVVRLFVDGEQLAEEKTSESPVQLEGGGLKVTVKYNLLDQITESVAVPIRENTGEPEADLVFAPHPAAMLRSWSSLGKSGRCSTPPAMCSWRWEPD